MEMVVQGRTQPAARLSERDLIALMEQHNIGTDATVAQHIQNQLDRGYATKDGNLAFWPTSLGEAMVGAYRKMGLENLWLPNLRYSSVPSVPPVMMSHLSCAFPVNMTPYS